MEKRQLDMIKEIDVLWQDVYPYLVRHVVSLWGRKEGMMLEMGPFCGVIFEMARAGIGSSFSIAAFPEAMAAFFREEAERRSLEDRIAVIETDERLSALEADSVDCAVFRGALFFPSLFRTDFGAVRRILRPGGMAFVGGGFGRETPQGVIEPIQERSRYLNTALGKVNINPEDVSRSLAEAGLEGEASVTTEGGLWVVLRKP